MSLNEEVGQRIKKYRTEKRISQQELGDRLGLTKSFVSKLETNRKKISLDRIESISNVLDIDPKQLLVDEQGDDDG